MMMDLTLYVSHARLTAQAVLTGRFALSVMQDTFFRMIANATAAVLKDIMGGRAI